MDDDDAFLPIGGGPDDEDREGVGEDRGDDAEDPGCSAIGYSIHHSYYKQRERFGPTLETCSDHIRRGIASLLERGEELLGEGWDLGRVCSAMYSEAGSLVGPFVEAFRRAHLGLPPLPSVGGLGTSQRAIVVTFSADHLSSDADTIGAAALEDAARRFATAWQQEVAAALPAVDVVVRWHPAGTASEEGDEDRMVAFLGDWHWAHANQARLADGVVELGRRLARSPGGWLAGADGEPPAAVRWWTVTRWGVEYDDGGAPALRRLRSGRYTEREEAMRLFEQLWGDDAVHTAWGPVQVWLEDADSADGPVEVASSGIPNGGLTAIGRRLAAEDAGVAGDGRGADGP